MAADSVGKRSMALMLTLDTVGSAIRAGQWKINGTRWPPSNVTYFVPRYGLAYTLAVGPLSDVKMMIVLKGFSRMLC